MAEDVQFENRMSDSDALMWHIERDPQLRSTITVLWYLVRLPAETRLMEKIDRASRIVPRLRERVASSPFSLAPPRWEVSRSSRWMGEGPKRKDSFG